MGHPPEHACPSCAVCPLTIKTGIKIKYNKVHTGAWGKPPLFMFLWYASEFLSLSSLG